MFSNDFRQRLALGKYANWAVDLTENHLESLLWMVGEYGCRSHLILIPLEKAKDEFFQDEEFARAKLALKTIGSIVGGRNLDIEEAKRRVCEVVNKVRSERDNTSESESIPLRLTDPSKTHVPGDRKLAIAGATALDLSTVFPLVAAIWPADQFPFWLGVVDVVLAFVVVAFAMWIDVRARPRASIASKVAAVQVYKAFSVLPFLLLLLFFLAGEFIQWQVLLPGLAWRSGVFLFSAEAACALLLAGAKVHGPATQIPTADALVDRPRPVE